MPKEEAQKNDDIELGSLFIIIGRGFSTLFNFIMSSINNVVHFFILVLLFLKRHFLKIALATIIGAVIGSFMEYNKHQRFGADMLVQPNFKSTRQLYSNIHYYNDLANQKDSILLAKTFSISNKEGASLKRFFISPVENDNDILTYYDELILSVDTLAAKSYSFDAFKKAFTKYDYKIHRIHVESTQRNLFSYLDDVIISSITENKYFNKLKKLTNENLNRTDSLLRKNLSQTDSLHDVYKMVMLENARKQTSGINIDLGGEEKSSNKELELFKTSKLINKDLKEIIEDKSDKSEIINIISSFQPIGYEIKGIDKNYGFLSALTGAGLMILLLLLLKLNRFLNSYKE
ncbi:hypothetical protein [Tenacibaculum maritimum]|uniref:hypothetical protein n=1 Tax=Tenacibaculum maritimum TaxID=107401 RepID=UPI0004005B47|nr:hypothetical protein [Tenacibaculum maritimum]CAA0155693.1 conserved membrane hypothetical protein [Tenacibaculum maritimum]CAA0166558.1 conserved membrane hypothetical protein [Tenacibaculum maritimum]CAA0181921.1 conserved membrane hypothetical protein [Tenacibaculum maritimum]CAA0185184.1 conserved membrane hypothetical protein [Tenacibaculum maritimum]CAA0220274.1 conserved membrane hypothetical protein [Tenacibaculum maritimum]